ncbi:GNAT family N-acetyltransferase [Rhodococcus erythropolis]|uniref:GNAT family N-acetyltransferase n=1 Tax=Rhodococcus erythropolis TaxID=1833 RepID=UPI003981AB22
MPRLGCGGYTLRGWEHADVDVLREAADDPYIPAITTVPARFDPPAAAVYIERQTDRARTGEGYSVVVIDDSARVVEQHRVVAARCRPRARRSGTPIVCSVRGKGCAAQLVAGLSGWAFTDLKIPRLELYVEPWNTASVRSAERAGFTPGRSAPVLAGGRRRTQGHVHLRQAPRRRWRVKRQ